jgi:hypothetical protein
MLGPHYFENASNIVESINVIIMWYFLKPAGQKAVAGEKKKIESS